MIQYTGRDIHTGESVTGWYVRANCSGLQVHIIIKDMAMFDGDDTFWTRDVHEVDPNTLDAVDDRIVYCKDCMNGRKKYLPNMVAAVECQKYDCEDPRQYRNLLDYCSRGVRRIEDDE